MHAQIAAAGGEASRLFADDAWQAVYHASGGIPRLINQVCDHALILAAATGRRILDAAVIEEAWADLQQLPLPWPTKTNAASATAETVVEFGSLAADDADAAELCDVLPVASPEAREVIDLTSQLEQIELHVAEWDAAEQPECPQPRETHVQKAARDGNTPRTIPAGLASDPFGDGFDDEEPVLDHYASLEAQSRRQGRRAPSPQEHEFAAAVQTIFEPLPMASGAAQTPASPALQQQAATVAPQVVAEAVQAPCDEPLAPVASEGETSDEADDGETPATLQVEALRILPPDDSDLIVVLDAEAHISQLSRTAGKAHRQEYRQLFTKLRGN
jgi:hypothetical protein